MSTSRDGDGPAEDRPADDRPAQDGRGWEPPGWSLPPAEPDRDWQRRPAGGQPDPEPVQDRQATPPPAQQPGDGGARDEAWDQPAPGQPWDQPAAPGPWDRPAEQQPPAPPRRGGLLGGLFGGRPRPPRRPTPFEEVFAPEGAPGGTWTDTASWGAANGWTSSDGTGPEDAAIVALTRTAPVRPGKDEVPANVLRGRADGLELVAYDIVSPMGRAWVAGYAVTAAPVLGEVPGFRLTPARFWRHGTGGLLQVPSGDPEFDTRWVLLVTEDGPRVRRLVEDPLVRQVLLGSDDGDELWSAAGFVAAVRPDGNRPLLIAHHARILAAVTAALASAY